MVPAESSVRSSAPQGTPMLKPLLACVFASLLTMPGCGKSERAAPPPRTGCVSAKRRRSWPGSILKTVPSNSAIFVGKSWPSAFGQAGAGRA